MKKSTKRKIAAYDNAERRRETLIGFFTTKELFFQPVPNKREILKFSNINAHCRFLLMVN